MYDSDGQPYIGFWESGRPVGSANINEAAFVSSGVADSEASPTDLSVDLRIFKKNYGPTDKRQKPTDKIR